MVKMLKMTLRMIFNTKELCKISESSFQRPKDKNQLYVYTQFKFQLTCNDE